MNSTFPLNDLLVIVNFTDPRVYPLQSWYGGWIKDSGWQLELGEACMDTRHMVYSKVDSESYIVRASRASSLLVYSKKKNIYIHLKSFVYIDY